MATKRKKTKEEEEIERQRALSNWNQGRDESLRELSRAEGLFSTRGYGAAKAAKDKDKVRAMAEKVVNATPNEDLPEAAKRMFIRKQEKVAELYDDFMRDADEFSGKPVGKYEPLKPAWKRREEEAEKQRAAAKKAADEKFDEVKSTPGAQVFDWRDVDGDPGRRREVRGIGDNKDEELVQIETPSGGFITARGKGLTDNLSKAEVRDREEMARAQKFQETLANNRRNAAMNRLTDSGYDWKSEDSAALFNPDGTLNTSKAKMAADRAEGLKAQATFESWDNDKELQRRAVAMEKNARSERSYLTRAQRGAYGLQAQREAQSPEGRARIARLENDLSAGETNRGGLEPGFWRQEAEKVDAAGAERRAAVMNLQAADEARAKSIMENSNTVGEALGRLYKQLENGEINIEQADAIQAYLRNKYGGNS